MVINGSEHVQITTEDGCVAQIRINRPARRNALSIMIKDEIADAVVRLDREPEVRAIVLTGGTSVFAAGTDVDEMVALTPIEHAVQATDRVFNAIRTCATPIIAAVEGYALGGGCELALSCDLIVAGCSARFGQPEIRVGVMPGAGATQRMVRTIGKYRTLRVLLTGDQITGEEAYAIGMISDVVADGTAGTHALALARQIAAMPQLAVQSILDVVEAGADVPLATALLLERKMFQVLFDSHDQKEGMQAFLEKRSPVFIGR